jgi:hypothetical protein
MSECNCLLCTDQGNLALLKLVCEGQYAQPSLNAGASKGQAPLMRACMQGCAPRLPAVCPGVSLGLYLPGLAREQALPVAHRLPRHYTRHKPGRRRRTL